jgi:dihydrodipicolinate synthase/N-acetylneuraminate lyase
MTTDSTRRAFLKAASCGALTGFTQLGGLPRHANAAPLARPLTPQAFKEHLAGPILSLPTTFRRDLSVNYEAVGKMIRRALQYGVPIIGLTAGNSKYFCLTFDEIKGVTRTMVEAVEQQALTIAATGAWPAEQVVDYAKHCESVGADSLQILLPKDVEGEDALYEHFQKIAGSTRLPLVLHGNYSRPLLAKLARIESIVAIKEDARLTYFIDRSIAFGERFSIFGGGGEYRYLVGYPYGSKAFFSTYTGFAPDKSMSFWKAIRSGDLAEATAITKKYDYPFIQRFSHPFWHATLEYFGVAERYMREPMKTLPTAKLKGVKSFFDGQGISPEQYE